MGREGLLEIKHFWSLYLAKCETENILGHTSDKTTMDMYGTLLIDEMQEIETQGLTQRRVRSLLRESAREETHGPSGTDF
jgi:hypothetical protein